MPELPEVENARRCLVRAGLPGRTFAGAEVGWAKTVKAPALEEFVLGLQGSRALDVHRRGKYILVPLLDDEGRDKTFILHLGMTGGLGVYPKSTPIDPMVRHIFPLDDGGELRFVDGRKFGKLWLVDDPAEVLPSLSPEPLEGGLTVDWLAESLAGRKVPIKGLLLEQSVVAGMGNIYADESLYLAEISPTALGGRTFQHRDRTTATRHRHRPDLRRGGVRQGQRRNVAGPAKGAHRLDHFTSGGRAVSPMHRPLRRHPCPGSRHLLLPQMPALRQSPYAAVP